jgi:hypothetical protein
MRSLAVLFVLCSFGLGFVQGAGAKAITSTTVSRTTSNGVTTNPCNGEPIAFETTATSVFHFVVDSTGVARISSTVTLGGKATGQVSGSKYVFGGASHVFSPFDPAHPDDFPITSTLTFVLVSTGTGPNLIQHQTLLLHFNAAGEVTVDLNDSTFECVA